MDKKRTLISAFVCLFISFTSFVSLAQEVEPGPGSRTNIIAWCYDEDSAIRLGNVSRKGFEAHRAFIQGQGNSCIYAGGQRFNAIVIEKTFKIGRLQFWLVLPDGAAAPVWVWTVLPEDPEV